MKHKMLIINNVLVLIFVTLILFQTITMLGIMYTGGVSIPLPITDPMSKYGTQKVIFESEPAYPHFTELNYTVFKPINVFLERNPLALLLYLCSLPLLYVLNLGLAIYNLRKVNNKIEHLIVISILTLLLSLLLVPTFLIQISNLA